MVPASHRPWFINLTKPQNLGIARSTCFYLSDSVILSTFFMFIVYLESWKQVMSIFKEQSIFKEHFLKKQHHLVAFNIWSLGTKPLRVDQGVLNATH